MDFCVRCGCYVNDSDVYCPECGNMVHQPQPESMPSFNSDRLGGNIKVLTMRDIFNKKFYIAFALSFIVMFAFVVFVGFSIFLFLIPMFIPAVKPDLSLGLMMGFIGGMVGGWLYIAMQSGFTLF